MALYRIKDSPFDLHKYTCHPKIQVVHCKKEYVNAIFFKHLCYISTIFVPFLGD